MRKQWYLAGGALFVVALCTLPLSAHARPVSYPGGWTAMQMNDANSSSLHLHYSPSANYSVGYKAEYWRDKNWQFHGAQLNYLLKRWNMPEAQANAYVKTAFGVAEQGGNTHTAAFVGFAADWETRRYFTSYENRYSDAGDIDHFYMQKARVGIAPYVGDYGDLHTWLMLEVDHNPTRQEKVMVTPMVRLFKDVYMAELGVSHRGDVMFNWVVRF
jgi:hypothetical protein